MVKSNPVHNFTYRQPKYKVEFKGRTIHAGNISDFELGIFLSLLKPSERLLLKIVDDLQKPVGEGEVNSLIKSFGKSRHDLKCPPLPAAPVDKGPQRRPERRRKPRVGSLRSLKVEVAGSGQPQTPDLDMGRVIYLLWKLFDEGDLKPGLKTKVRLGSSEAPIWVVDVPGNTNFSSGDVKILIRPKRVNEK